MAFYNDDVIQQLKAHTDISVIVERFVPLKKSGPSRYIGKCPFHDDRSPSMSVNPQMGIYKCFACGAGGDVLKFIMEHEKMDFKAAVEWVASETNFPLPSLQYQENPEKLEERSLVRELNELACTWFEEQLSLNNNALNYLLKRNISLETRQKLRIGYAPNSPNNFISLASKKGFSPKDIVQAGLAVEKQHGGFMDKFRDRLMIPIHNLTGMVVAFGGRSMQENTKGPKYMNSPETVLYTKSDILYGLNHSKNFISKENAAILVEGYFDFISLYQAGIQNVVAVSGTALTENHAKILSRYAQTAYLVFDSDEAGKKATQRSLEILLPTNTNPKILSLKSLTGEKIDPDTFIQEHGVENFQKELSHAADWLNYLGIEMDTSSIENKASFISYAKSLIASIKNKELQIQYLNLIAERFNTNTSLAQIKPIGHSKKRTWQAENNTKEAPISIPWHLISGIELRFINLLLKNKNLWGLTAEFFSLEFIAQNISLLESPLLEELLGNALSLYGESKSIDLKILYSISNPPLPTLLEDLPEELWEAQSAQKEFLDTLLYLIKRKSEEFSLSLKQKEDEESTLLRLKIISFSKEQQKLLQQNNLAQIDESSLFQKILENRNKLVEFHMNL